MILESGYNYFKRISQNYSATKLGWSQASVSFSLYGHLYGQAYKYPGCIKIRTTMKGGDTKKMTDQTIDLTISIRLPEQYKAFYDRLIKSG